MSSASQMGRARQFLLPDLGEGLEEAQLVQWLVAVGDVVSLNQPLCQVETAKALVDIPSPFAGTVQTLHGAPGNTVAVGSPLITILEAAAESAASGTQSLAQTNAASSATDGASRQGPVLVGYGSGGGPEQTFTRRRRGASSQPAALPVNNATATGTTPAVGAAAGRPPSLLASAPATTPAPTSQREVSASPLVRKIAADRGIDLSTLTGTGPNGRVRVEDLEAASANRRPPDVPTSLALSDDEERISTVGLRKAIAAKMVRSATTIPHFTEYGLFDATSLIALRDRLRADPVWTNHKLTFLPFFIKALVEAVRAYPIMNSRWDEEGNAIVLKRSISVGIATDTARGLIVPVVHNAHTLSLAQIVAETERLTPLAREGKLPAAEMTGGTITITNVGAMGPVETGAPLINAPEVCVVGFGAIKPRPTVVGDVVLVRPGAWLSISCDHRVVDGATAAQFLGALVRALEQPETLV
ncbi:MAG: dihydrolipoamide acetyltransferase family protein [Ktedonobacterales bacterium]